MLDADFVHDLFKKLEEGKPQEFFSHLADDVSWTVKGSFEFTRTYDSKADFLENAFSVMQGVLKEGLTFKVNNIIIKGDIVVAEMDSCSTQMNGKPYNNYYCWVMEFKDKKISRVRAYLDTALLNEAVVSNS